LIVAEKIEIDSRYCKGCMLCRHVCEFDVFEVGQTRSALDYLMPRVANLSNCKLCRKCQTFCPEMTLSVVAKKKKEGGV